MKGSITLKSEYSEDREEGYQAGKEVEKGKKWRNRDAWSQTY